MNSDPSPGFERASISPSIASEMQTPSDSSSKSKSERKVGSWVGIFPPPEHATLLPWAALRDVRRSHGSIQKSIGRLELDHLDAVRALPLIARGGTPVTVGALTREKSVAAEAPIYHKNLRPVSYVIAEVGGRTESPVYALLDLKPRIEALAKEAGIELETWYTRAHRGTRQASFPERLKLNCEAGGMRGMPRRPGMPLLLQCSYGISAKRP